MDSNIESGDDWISKFRSAQNFDQSVLDTTNGPDSAKQDLCYTISETSDNPIQQLEFNSEDCFTMAYPVCLIEKTNVYLGLPLPRFPCVTTNEGSSSEGDVLSRKRRNIDTLEDNDVKVGGKQGHNGHGTNRQV